MLRNIAVLAIACFAATNAVSLEKCKPKGEPVFLDHELHVEEIVGNDPATWGPAEKDAETAISHAIGVLAKGDEMTQDEAEA